MEVIPGWDPMGKNMPIFKVVPIHGQSLAYSRHMFPSQRLVIEATALNREGPLPKLISFTLQKC